MYRLHRRQASAGGRGFPSIWDSSEAWAACAKALRDYDEDMIQDWKEEIDTLLVFAGLFSAVVTAFNIESYQLLQQQPEDSATAILMQISSQLNSFTVNSNFINATHPAEDVPPFQPNAFAVRLNALWFSSLVCSLLSASLGLLVKQWLREYLAGSSNISRESIRIRQYRYEGLRKWHVAEIILCLPILLQAALLLFFIGLLDLLWSLHPVVAAVVTTIIAVSMMFAITTSLLPPFYPDCPYKSPQSWLICIFLQSIKRSIAALASHYYARLYHHGRSSVNDRAMGALTPDIFASRLDLPTIVHSKLSETLRTWLHHLSVVRPYSSWKEREKLLTEKGRVAAALDDATLAGADAMFMDDAFLHAVVRPCMSDIAPRAALRCVDRILLRRAPRVMYGMPFWELAHSLDAGQGDTGTLTLMHLLLDVLHRLNANKTLGVETWEGEEEPSVEEAKDDARRKILMTMHRLVRAIPAPGKYHPHSTSSARGETQTVELFRRMFEVLAGVLDGEVGRATPERFVRERSFNLMLKLFPRFQDVGPTCITAFCAYSRQTRIENTPYRFVQASYMVVRASALLARTASRSSSLAMPQPQPDDENASPPALLPYVVEPHPHTQPSSISPASSMTFCSEPRPLESAPSNDSTLRSGGPDPEPPSPVDDYTLVRPELLKVLHDLEGFFSTPVARAAEYRPTMAMLSECAQALLALAERDRGAVSPGLIGALDDVIGYASIAESRDGWEFGGGGEQGRRKEELDASTAKHAVRWLRRMYGMRRGGGGVAGGVR